MKIKLDEKKYLNSDKYCLWITTLYADKTGKVSEKRISGYYQSFNKAVEDYIDKRVHSSEAEDIKALNKEIQELKKTVLGWGINILPERFNKD